MRICCHSFHKKIIFRSHVGNCTRVVLDHIVGEVDQKLSEAPLSCCIIAENGRKCGVAERLGETLSQCFTGAGIVTEPVERLLLAYLYRTRPLWISKSGKLYVPEEASDDMLEQASGLGFDQLSHHVAENCTDRVESLIGGANVVETVIVKQNLLHDKDSHGLAKFGACLHDAQAKRDDLGGEEEVNHLGRVVLDESTNNTQACEAEILEGARLGCCVEEGIEEQGNVSCIASD